MIETIKLYCKLAWYCRTPFIFLLDKRYKTIPLKVAKCFYATRVINEKYIPDYFDCDDYAWVLKALASKEKLNSIGFVIGWARGLHCWNIVLCNEGIYQIEPQNGEIGKRLISYKPIVIVI